MSMSAGGGVPRCSRIVGRLLAGCVLGALAAPAAAQSSARSQVLWYDTPATQWVEALPVGNGRLGAMVFGGVARERIQFNEATIWTGGPLTYARPGASRYLKRPARAALRGTASRGGGLAQVHFMSAPLRQRAYQAFGDLRLEFPTIDSTRIQDYRRELDLDRALTTTRLRVDGVSYERQVFASHPDGVVVMR
jgi:alpha-L-fucosidase 2